MLQSLCSGRIHHSLRHGMGKMLLQTGRQPQNLVRILPVAGYHPRHRRPCLRQGPRLVKDNGIRLRHGFQIFSSLYRHMKSPCLPDGGKHGNRDRQLQRAGKVHQQHRQHLCHVFRKKPGQGRPCQRPGHQSVCQMLRFPFHRGFQLFRFLDHGCDALIFAGAGSHPDTDGQLALLHNGSGVYGGSLCPCHRHGFSRQGSLVYHRLPGFYRPIEGDHVSHMDNHQILLPHLRGVHQDLLPVTKKPHLFNIQRHAPGQIAHRFFMGPFLQNFSDAQQEHDGSCRIKISAEHRYADGRRVQHRHLQLPPCQRAQAVPQISAGSESSGSCPYGIRKKQLASRPQHHFHH